MPRYLYADSTEFQLQRDFIDILERFSDAALEAIPTQEEIIDLKRNISKTESNMKSSLSEIESFGKEVESAIGDVTSRFGEERFGELSESVKEDARGHVTQFRESEEKRFKEEVKNMRKALEKKQAGLLQVLGEFLYYDPLEIATLKITVGLEEDKYLSVAKVFCESGIYYEFGLSFFDRKMEVKDLIEKPIEVPAAMKKPIMAKEKKPRFVSINDWTLTSAEYESNGETLLKVTLTRDEGDEDSPRAVLTVKPGEERLESLVYRDEDGTTKDVLKDAALKQHIDEDIEEYCKFLLGHFYSLLNKKEKIEGVKIEGDDVVPGDLAEEFIMRCAREYGPIVKTIKERGLVEGELNLKAEDLEGKRTELYLKIDEYRSKMSTIPQGKEICSIMNL